MTETLINTIYQLKIELDNLDPIIWRRVLVPSNYSFAQLHDVIQSAMGWTNSHLHEFIFDFKKDYSGTRISMAMTDDCDNQEEASDENTELLSTWFAKKKKAKYLYDFGDSWMHTITVEKVIEPALNQTYPQCIDGEYACPPEDCMGAPGYSELMMAWHAVADGDTVDEEMQDRLDFYRIKDPYTFNPKKVKFRKALTTIAT